MKKNKQRVLEIFEEILSIPRSSGKEEKISNYIVEYAKSHNLEYKKDEYNNVFIRKNNKRDKTIILQAHSDMVCVSNNNYDFDNKGIDYYIDGDYYKAKNTTLGADDGIGLAIILAMLEEENMPNIEALITTQEETTMLGATNFDYSLLTGKTLINLDGTDEGKIESSCAGMCSIVLSKKVTKEISELNTYKLVISNLKGGHSGSDIDKNRMNAIKLGFELLKKINIDTICDFKISKKANVIPSEGFIIFTSNKEINELRDLINNIDFSLSCDDNGLNLQIEEYSDFDVINESKEIIGFINDLDNGVLAKYDDGFPLLSSNIGTLNLIDDDVIIDLSIRSSDIDFENNQIEKLENLCRKYNFTFEVKSKIPSFAYLKESRIRKLLADTYKQLYSKDAITSKVHACMEIGVISSKIDDLDIVTIGPTIMDYHSINEKVSISSTERVYRWLKETLTLYNKS